MEVSDRASEAVEKYGDLIRRICFLNLENKTDVEDVFQDVFLKFMLHSNSFENEEHEKAWLCRVTYNQCKDLRKSFWKSRVDSIEEMEIPCETPEPSAIINAVLALPPDLRQIIYLHFYEGMTIPEIAVIMSKNINTVYTKLHRAKAKLKTKLREDYLHETL